MFTVINSLVDHHFTKHDVEQFSPPVWHPGCFHVNITTFERFRAIKVKPRIEERSVLPCDHSALFLRRQTGIVKLRLVRDVDTQTVQVVYVVGVGGDLV